MNLSDQTLLITGASSGFGQAIAQTAVAQGVKKIYVTGRRQERLQNLQKHAGCEVVPLVFNIQDKNAVFDKLGALKDVTALIANAGLALGNQPVPNVNIEDWETMVQTNILGLLYSVQAVLPHMKKHNCGHIITMGSIAGNWPYPGSNVYGATKAFVKQFAINLKTELLGTAIRVTNIEPGLAQTEFSNVRFKGDKTQAQAVYQGTQPLTAQDIANATLWVLSQPEHVNVNSIEIMPTCQAPGGLAIARLMHE